MTDLNRFVANVSISSDYSDNFDFEDVQDEEEETKQEDLTLETRMNGHIVECFNYLKHDGGKYKGGSKPTGKALVINEVESLAVIDVDIKKDHDIIREDILAKLCDEDVVVKTGSGGLHIYCNKGCFKPASNRMIKIYTCDDYDIDIMCTVDSKKRSLVMLPESRVRSTHKGNETCPRTIGSYEFVRGNWNSIVKRTVNQVLYELDIQLPEAEIKEAGQAPGPIVPMKTIKRENREEPDTIISNELTEAIVNGLSDLVIHNDGGSRPIDKEITLFTLFPALNSLNSLYIDDAYDNVFTKCNLTLNAQVNFLRMKERYSTRETSPYLLVKMLKIWKPEYYDEVIRPIMEGEEPKISQIDLTEEFSMPNIKKNCEDGVYTSDKEVVQDLSKVIRYVIGTENMFLLKYYDTKRGRYTMGFVLESTMMTYLKKCRAWRVGKKIITLADVMNRNETKLTVKGVAFRSDDPNVFSLFQGYKYPILDVCDYDLIKPFMELVREVICNENPEIYEYVLNWLGYIIQNPGEKTKTAIVLKGLQGIGKGTFTDTICEMLSGYSASNVTEIAELTGTFNSVVENKMLIILNELKNCGDDRGANFNSLKSIITESDIRINEKNQPRRDGDNVANFIFVTNNAYPVKIETGDRRYLVLKVNGKYKGNLDYFQTLYNLRKNPDFYPNLLTFFAKKDISSFVPARIPMTDAKMDIINASLSDMEQWIIRHYVQLKDGMLCSEARATKPYGIRENSFHLLINEKCEHTRKTIDKKQVYVYKLKEECIPLYERLAAEYTFPDELEEE